MWVGGFQTVIEMDKTFTLLKQSNLIDPEYEGRIPENARKLILWMV